MTKNLGQNDEFQQNALLSTNPLVQSKWAFRNTTMMYRKYGALGTSPTCPYTYLSRDLYSLYTNIS